MDRLDIIKGYTEAIKASYETGQATEHAYRPALQQLMSRFDDTDAVNDPKRSEHGNPDFVFLKKSNKHMILGYAEAKDIDVSLDKTEKTDQMHRYAGYDNLFLTNSLEFRFFKNGDKYQTINIGELKNGRIEFYPDRFAMLHSELAAFLEQPPEQIRSGKRLAQIMGAKAIRIRDNVAEYLSLPSEKNAELEKIYQMMQTLLVHDLTIEKFADMYAQTLVYGLFVARYNDDELGNFTRNKARDLVPASNPFLREFFDHIVGPHFVTRLGYIVDELCEVFSVSDVHTLVQKHLRLFEVENDKDPIIHFYEDFLKEYDPAERKKMGAYYTPIPVVRFIIRNVDEILKREFDLPKGLTDTSKKPVTVTSQGIKTKVDMHKVQILDPAVGTATFLNEAIKFIYQGFEGQEGRWPSYVEHDLLPRLYGFELMMAPYTIAHLKLGMTLQETGVKDFRQRLGVYLTNTLEEGIKSQLDIFSFGLAEAISKEAEEAAKIKTERPIMVIIGNPPYSGESSNKTEYAMRLVAKYKFEPGDKVKLQERNPKWINDDYVKFMAFAEDMIAKNGEGVVAMITNHSYLDNPTFRGMRWHLAKTFDKIFILDLHGNAKKKEAAPDGSKDENVFAIQQGVAIMIGIRTHKKIPTQPAEVFHAELYGKRKDKFEGLRNGPKWKQLALDKRMYYFTDRNVEGKEDYDQGISINDLFPVSSVGVVTAADNILINYEQNNLLKNIEQAKLASAKGKVYERVRNHEVSLQNIQPISYRPFDNRYIYYSTDILERARENVMQHFLKGKNIGLMVCRQQKTDGFRHALVHNHIPESSYVSNKTSEIGSSFPLFLYHDDGTRTPNFRPEKLKEFTKNLEAKYVPEDILDYIYAILHSPSYRNKYKEFLKADFPRVPVPANDKTLRQLASFGKKLRELHLMTLPEASQLIITFPITDDNEVEQVKYEAGKVHINATQYFGDVPEATWSLRIGGYQPAQKWLKDRKGRKLTNEDIEHYQKIIKVLAATNGLMYQVDSVDIT
jgi:predicted helicase